jgi:hypothetical protein
MDTGETPLVAPTFSMIVPAVLCFVYLLVSLVLIVAGWKMGQLEVQGMAVFASILALIPFHPSALLGFPAGIWSVTVLNTDDVKTAFR